MASEPDISQLLAIIKKELDGGKRTINIWDGNHHSPAPAQVAYSRELYDLIRQYGAPAYVVEHAQANKAEIETFQKKIEEFKALSPEALQTKLTELKEGLDGRTIKSIELLAYAAEGATIILPDPRGEDERLKREAWRESLGPQEQELLTKIEHGVEIEITIDNKDMYQSLIAKDNELKSESYFNHGDPILNARIAANIQAELPPNAVTVNLYGLAHFHGLNDLNERLGPSLNIAVADLPPEERKKYYANNIMQMPDYVFYPQENRLVKMDTVEAQQEFLGMNAMEYATYQARLAISSNGTKIIVPDKQGEQAPAAPSFRDPSRSEPAAEQLH